MIEAKDVTRTFELGKLKVEVLKGISINVGKGELVGIMGPSGSGKSTLLFQIGLLDSPTSGNIIIDGMDPGNLTEAEKTKLRLTNIGYVFQDYALLPELNAFENIILPAMATESSKSEYIKRAKELIKIVDIEERANHLPSELSGGEQQRVAVARSLINNPKVLLADEPCANLDSNHSRDILELFRKVNREMGVTVVVVTHEDWHRKYFDRVIMLKDGLVVGKPMAMSPPSVKMPEKSEPEGTKLLNQIKMAEIYTDDMKIMQANKNYVKLVKEFSNRRFSSMERKDEIGIQLTCLYKKLKMYQQINKTLEIIQDVNEDRLPDLLMNFEALHKAAEIKKGTRLSDYAEHFLRYLMNRMN